MSTVANVSAEVESKGVEIAWKKREKKKRVCVTQTGLIGLSPLQKNNYRDLRVSRKRLKLSITTC